MYQHMSSKQLKQSAKARISACQGICIGAAAGYLGILSAVYLFSSLFLAVSSSNPILSQVMYSLITGVLSGMLSAGFQCFFLKLYCGRVLQIADLFYAFRIHTGTFFSVSLLLAALDTLVHLPSDILSNILLGKMSFQMITYTGFTLAISLCVMTYIKLNYSQVYFLALDYPSWKLKDLFPISRRFMKGHKGRLFYLYASFLPLIFLSVLSLGIGFLWLLPYMQAVLTEFYLDIARGRVPNTKEASTR